MLQSDYQHMLLQYNRAPSPELSGTVKLIMLSDDTSAQFMSALCLFFVRLDINHCSAVPLVPKVFSSILF